MGMYTRTLKGFIKTLGYLALRPWKIPGVCRFGYYFLRASKLSAQEDFKPTIEMYDKAYGMLGEGSLDHVKFMHHFMVADFCHQHGKVKLADKHAKQAMLFRAQKTK